jgi:hypothetical protein
MLVLIALYNNRKLIAVSEYDNLHQIGTSDCLS